MAVISEKELSQQNRALWLKATSAIETRNYGYAITLIQGILKESPDFLTGRQWLRRAEVATTKGKKGFLGGGGAASLQVMKAQGSVKKDPKSALIAAEEMLEKDPHSVAANGLLRDAAAALTMTETVGFALETMRDSEPKNTKILHELARHYVNSDQAEKAIDVYNAITAITPSDGEAIKGGKDAAARASMRTGGWDQIGKEGTSYRDVLKNKEEAKALEQENRLVKSVDDIDALLVEQFAKYNEDPNVVDVVLRIAKLHEQKEDLEGALQYFSWANELTKGGDPGLIRKVAELNLKNVDHQIDTRTKWLADHAAATNGAELDEETRATVAQVQQDLQVYEAQKAEMQINNARQRVERNPTDLTFRYELGEQLVKAGHHSEAIAELQKAQNSPNLGIRAKYLLGQCFEVKNINNLAVKQYEDAKSKLPQMDGFKKDIVYRLGLLYERTGDKEKYMANMTEIYEVDSAYQDVAARVEGGYA